MNELFDTNAVLQDSPRLKAIKDADIQTHYAPNCVDDPWIAVPMKLAKEYIDEHDFIGITDITASHGIVLDDHGMIFYGQTKQEVEDDALAYVARKSHSKTL